MVRFFTEAECRSRRSAKWTLYDPDVLPLPVAEMDVELAPAIADALRAAVDRSDTGYPPMDGSHGDALRDFAQRRWDWQISREAVVPTSDVGSAVVTVLEHMAGPGPVVVSPPVYPQFHAYPGLAGRGLVTVPLARAGGGRGEGTATYRLDLPALERAFAEGASAYVLCHPHNPVGLVHTRVELAELARMAREHGVLIVSDEVHAPLVFASDVDRNVDTDVDRGSDHNAFVPFLASCPEAAEVGVAVHSPSKAWNLAGLKCAFIVAENPRLRERLAPVIDELPWQTGIFGALAAEAAYRRGSDWLDELNTALVEHHALLAAELAEHLPAARVTPAGFGYLAWVDLAPLGWDERPHSDPAARPDPAEIALRRGRVALGIGPAFGEGGEGFVRVNLGTHPDTIREAVRRLAATDRALRT